MARRQRSIALGDRYRQVSLYMHITYCSVLLQQRFISQITVLINPVLFMVKGYMVDIISYPMINS